MNFLYPRNLSIKVLILALLITGSSQAQTNAVAVVNSTVSSARIYVNPLNALIKIKYRSDRQIVLNWQPVKGGISHYVLERSADGKRYDEAGVFFTGEWDNEPEYIHKDQLRKAYSGPLYYRLKVVGLNGNEVYTLPTVSEK